MNPPRPTTRRLLFGRFTLDRNDRVLLRAGRPVPLEPQPFRVLEALLERPAEIVTREELRRRIWGDQHVQVDDGLNYCVRQIRTALGERAGRPSYVETLPRRGYRFIAPVRADADTGSSDRRRFSRQIGAVSAVAAAALIAALLSHAPALGGSKPARLAVLPFEAATTGPEARARAEGLTEDLITELARYDPGELAVIAASSSGRYGTDTALETLKRDLGVAWIVVGRVTDGPASARVGTRLVRVADASHVWAESYPDDRDGVRLSRMMARQIAAAAAPGAARPRARAGDPLPPAAREAYLRGRYVLNHGGPGAAERAEALFGQALEIAPDHATPRAGLARALTAGWALPPGRADSAASHARQALARDPDSVDAWIALGDVRLFAERSPAEAAEAYDRALARAPGRAEAHKRRALAHSAAAEHTAALARLGRALELDPVSVSLRGDVAWFYFRARRFALADAAAGRALELEPGSPAALACRVASRVRLGDWEGARASARELAAARGGAPPGLDGPDPRAALQRFWAWQASLLAAGAPAARRATLAVHRGDADDAFAALEEVVERGERFGAFLRIEPRVDALRDDPRFATLLDRAGLAAGVSP